MSEDLVIDTNEEEQEESDLTSDIANLAAAFSNLGDIDPGLMNKSRQGKLAKMKRQVFDALCWYCDCLPSPEKEDE